MQTQVIKPATGVCLVDAGRPMTTTIGSIHKRSWLTFTYVASNPDAQRLIAGLLGNFRDIEVSTRTTGDDGLSSSAARIRSAQNRCTTSS